MGTIIGGIAREIVGRACCGGRAGTVGRTTEAIDILGCQGGGYGGVSGGGQGGPAGTPPIKGDKEIWL